jgi:hypothetical protein
MMTKITFTNNNQKRMPLLYAKQQGAQTITIDQEERRNHHIAEG